MRFNVPLALVVATGCTSVEESTTDQDLISTTFPYRYNVTTSSIIPDLGVSGVAAPAPALLTAPYATHEGTFGNGVTSKATVSPSSSPDPFGDWLTWSQGGPGGSWSQFESAPPFKDELTGASTAADPVLAADKGQLDDLETALSLTPLHVTHETTPSFFGWPAEQARWLRSQYVAPWSGAAFIRQVYADPTFGAEIRDRGARLYCAAHTAALQQADTHQVSMGEQTALTLSILGHEVKLGVVEPTFRLDAPKKLTGSPGDGAQTFEVPMHTGAVITPIKGLGLPGFGELRTPVSLITGDTEVASALPPVMLHTGDRVVCGLFTGCRAIPTYSSVPPKDYLTVTHTDAVRSQSETLTATTDEIPVFSLGIFTVRLKFGGRLAVGAPPPTQPDDRLLAAVPSWWPMSTRTGGLTDAPWPGYQYDDEPWQAAFDVDAPVSTSASVFSLAAARTSNAFAPSDPMLMRALEDDDHHVATETSVQLDGSVIGDLGFNIGIAHFDLKGTGSIGIRGTERTDIRDSAMAVTVTPGPVLAGNPPGIPMTALTVTPSTSANVNFGLTVELKLHIPLPWPLDDIDESFTIINTSTEHVWDGAPFPQQRRALIATGSSFGNPTTQPWAVSHLPYTGDLAPSYPRFPVFDSFTQDVNTCLADTREPPPLPDPCKSPVPEGPAHGNVCVFTGSWMVNIPVGRGFPSDWTGACSNISPLVDTILPAGTNEQKQCYRDVLAKICVAPALEQDWNGQHGVSHVIDMAHPGNDLPIDQLMDECGTAFLPDSSADTFRRIFQFGACDDSGKMIDPDKVITPVGSPVDGTPSPIGAGSCT